METYIVYFDETGDDGVTTASSSHFVLTSLYMPASCWHSNYDIIKSLRKDLKDRFGFHLSQEMHTKAFLTDKTPYRDHKWTQPQKREILLSYLSAICKMDASIINVIIDKARIKSDTYPVLENALIYNIQQIENDSKGTWNYLIITDRGRIAPMRKTARAIRVYHPIPSKDSSGYSSQPIQGLIEDILEKDSRQSHFIQLSDFISYFVHLYYKTEYEKEPLPNRIQTIIDVPFVHSMMDALKAAGKRNRKASGSDSFGLVIYPE